jgi:non-lysosomal glucosylceramidase
VNDASGKANRRTFLKTAAVAGSLPSASPAAPDDRGSQPVAYPRRFSGRQLQMLAFPLGGIAAGSISLGGRGQLRDWEIFNKADKGRSPSYAFPSIWVQAGSAKPVAKVLEARLQPPYQAAEGLGPGNAPGLQRFASAVFQGEYPLARVEFQDSAVAVEVELEAFTPIIPLDAEESGLPVAVLRYKVTNPGAAKAIVSIAFSIDNPVGGDQKRVNEVRTGSTLQGIYMHAPELDAKDPMK